MTSDLIPSTTGTAFITPKEIKARLEQDREDPRSILAKNTERALRADSAVFAAWCTASHLVNLPATPETLVRFVDEMSLSRKSSTIRRYVSSIASMHRRAALPNPAEDKKVSNALRRMSNANKIEQRQVHGVVHDLRQKMLAATGLTLRDLRNRALLCVAYDTLARRSELVAMLITDLHLFPAGDGTITIRRGKTDQAGEGMDRYLAPDTVEAVLEWLRVAQITGGPLFRSILKGSRLAGQLPQNHVARVFKEIALKAGIAPDLVERISAHSTRVGAAQDMADSGQIELPSIMQAGGWKSPQMVARYTREQDARRGGAAKLAALQGRR